jgi:uncharacterized YccA/Bax inhibitor family protein
MQQLAGLVSSIAGLVGLICFILVLIQMFQRGQTGLAIACIVLFFCALLGMLIAFVYGWMKAREWNIQNIMMIWTGCIVLQIIGTVIAPPDFSQFRGVPAR